MGTKKQHYVPQLHLRRFALSNGRLAVFDKTNSHVRWLTPEQTGHENHFLTIPELDGDEGSGAFFERLFGHAEEIAAPAIRDLIERLQLGVAEVISTDTRQVLSRFLALQYLRTRAARDRNAQMRDAFKRAMREVRGEGTPEFQRWIDEGLAKESDDRRDHARYILNSETVATLAAVLNKHVWLVFSAPSSLPFYSSDHPVALHSHVRYETRGYGLDSKGVEVEFPLTPRYLLSLFERTWLEEMKPAWVVRDGCLAGALTPEHVTFQRSLQVVEARRFVYCSTDDFSLAAEMCETHPETRDPNRNRIVAYYDGRPV